MNWKDADCSNVTHWLAKNGMNTRVSAAATHLDLSGGMYTIPSVAIPKFYEMVARDMRGSVPFFLCEKRPDISPFYIDMDYAGADILSLEDVFHISMTLQLSVRRCYPLIDDGLWRSIGLVSVLVCDEATSVVVNKRNFVKTGVHIIFPNLFVTEEQCSQLAQHAIQYMMVHSPQTANMLPWVSIIDLCVYGTGKGLRMLGASKCLKCVVCAKKTSAERRSCALCMNGVTITGRGRIYSPCWIIEGGDRVPAENTPRFKNSTTYALSISSILDASGCVQTRPVSGFVLPIDFVMLEKRSVSALARVSANEISLSDMRVTVMQKLVRSICREWSSIIFSKVTFSGEKSNYYNCKAFVGSSGSRFCQNVGRDHSMSSIYFMVTQRGIMQRCFSKKNCQKYSSAVEPLGDIQVFTYILFEISALIFF
jgi:hypothetical protein